jgi:hypothetical protein
MDPETAASVCTSIEAVAISAFAQEATTVARDANLRSTTPKWASLVIESLVSSRGYAEA